MKRILIVTAALALMLPAALWAQDELSLEGLADQLTALAGRVDAIEDRFADPWSPDIVYTDDGVCQNPLHLDVSLFKDEGGIHQTTADAYRSKYGVSIDPASANLRSISFGVESSEVYLLYELTFSDQIVVEKWAHCEFLGHSDWEDQ